MSKINKEFAILIVFLILIIFAGTFMKTPVDTKTSVKELKVAGFFIGFEDSVSKSEVQTSFCVDFSLN